MFADPIWLYWNVLTLQHGMLTIKQEITDYWRLLEITRKYKRLLEITRGIRYYDTEDYYSLLKITGDYWRLLEITRDYWRLLEVASFPGYTRGTRY